MSEKKNADESFLEPCLKLVRKVNTNIYNSHWIINSHHCRTSSLIQKCLIVGVTLTPARCWGPVPAAFILVSGLREAETKKDLESEELEGLYGLLYVRIRKVFQYLLLNFYETLFSVWHCEKAKKKSLTFKTFHWATKKELHMWNTGLSIDLRKWTANRSSERPI